jgi:hypothetical protein
MNKFQQLLSAAKGGDLQLIVHNDPSGGRLFYRIDRRIGTGPACEGVGITKMHLEQLQRAGVRVREFDENYKLVDWPTPPPAPVVKPVPVRTAAPAKHSAPAAPPPHTMSAEANAILRGVASLVSKFIVSAYHEQKGKAK